MIAWASVGGVSGPKFMVPRQRRLTLRPERPRWIYSMLLPFHVPANTVPGHPLAGAAGGRAVTARGTPAHVHERLAAGIRRAQPGRGCLALGRLHLGHYFGTLRNRVR